MDISIITPCYNHGMYLDDAIASIKAIKTNYSYEHIIINDGSTDLFTLKKLEELESSGVKVIHQSNSGLATARNKGISIANGKYIIPLDSDNKLHSNYLTKAIDILEANELADVVHGNWQEFGAKSEVESPGVFDFHKMLVMNRIDACTVIRKNFFDKAGGYDTNMPAMGNEDWELWVNFFLTGANFYYLNEVGFYYRVVENSMSATTTRPSFEKNRAYILKKHAVKIVNFYRNDRNRLLTYIKKHRIKACLKILAGKKI